MIFNKADSQTGSVGILAIIALALLTVVGAGMVTRTSTEINMAANYRDGVAAQYLAEAGAQFAIAQIKADPAYKPNGTVTNTLSTGSYSIRVEDIAPAPNKRIISSGTAKDAKRTVIADVIPAISGGNKMFNSAVASLGKLLINNPQIYGDVATNVMLEITTSTPNAVTGSGYSQSTQYYNSAVVGKGFKPIGEPATLDVHAMMPVLTMTGTNLTATWTNGRWGGHTYTLLSGSYYYDGNYDLNGHSYRIETGQNVTIYIDGNFTLMAGSKITVNGGKLTVYATGGVNFHGGSIEETNNAISRIYAKNNVALSSNSSISGTCLIVTLGEIAVNGINAPNTVLISNKHVQGNAGSSVAGIYSAGTVTMTGATVTYNATTMSTLGLTSGSTQPFKLISFNSHI